MPCSLAVFGAYNRQPSHLLLLHHFQCVVNFRIARTTVHFPRHHLFDADIRWVAMLCRRRHADIAVGYHAHDFPRHRSRPASRRKSPLHICIAASARLVSGRQLCTSYVITSCTFILFYLSYSKFKSTTTECAQQILRRTAQFLLSRDWLSGFRSRWLRDYRSNRFQITVATKPKMYFVTNVPHHALIRLQTKRPKWPAAPPAKRRMGSLVFSRAARVARFRGP